VTLNERTIAMLTEAERLLGFQLTYTQGSYRPPTDYSGTSHTGGGAVDISLVGLSDKRKRRILRVLRDIGFAAWWRTTAEGDWIEHIHALAIGDVEMSESAAWQVGQYLQGYNGLSAGVPDRNSYRPYPAVVFKYRAWCRKQTERARLERLGDRAGELLRGIKSLRRRLLNVRAKRQKIKEH
jgi:hypothetical protein